MKKKTSLSNFLKSCGLKEARTSKPPLKFKIQKEEIKSIDLDFKSDGRLEICISYKSGAKAFIRASIDKVLFKSSKSKSNPKVSIPDIKFK